MIHKIKINKIEYLVKFKGLRIYVLRQRNVLMKEKRKLQ